jgi:GNAT acetyltransferase-like protein
MAPEAYLVADRGAAAATPEFFRCPRFLAAEGVSHTLVIEGAEGRAAIPVIRRRTPDGRGWDASSPYGYPGGSLTGRAPDPGQVDLSHLGLVSVFVRDQVGRRTLRRGRRRARVYLHDPARPRRLRAAIARAIRRNQELGLRAEALPGPEVPTALVRAFAASYTETMRTVGASGRYFYPSEYLKACLRCDRSWLVAVWAPGPCLAAGMLIVRSDGMLHYYLGATTDAYRHRSPAKNAFLKAVELADALGVPLNFGGGLTPGDGLEQFKRGFSNQERDFVVHELVADPQRYAALAGSARAASFFPAYRAPSPPAAGREPRPSGPP